MLFDLGLQFIMNNIIKPLEYTGSFLRVLDQTLLPEQEIYYEYSSYQEVILAIQKMIIRGAPSIGLAGAWACCLAGQKIKNKTELLKAFEEIAQARPTAVNLAKAVNRLKNTCLSLPDLELEANKMFEEDFQMCQQMASYGLTVLPNKSEYKFLTHCNTGSLATAGIGTALGIFKLLALQSKKRLMVYACETRPYLQGARLTAWELHKLNIPVTLLPDSAAAHLLKTEKIDAVFVGADRIVANGDTANKIGTYSLALAALVHKTPFYIVAPSTSIDLSLATGEEIEIEQRPKEELIYFQGKQIAPSQINCFNPAFDITPHNLITAFITEKGICSPEKLKNLFQNHV